MEGGLLEMGTPRSVRQDFGVGGKTQGYYNRPWAKLHQEIEKAVKHQQSQWWFSELETEEARL